MPRVMLVVNALERHGPGMVVWALARGLRARDWSVWVASLDAPDEGLAQELAEADVRLLRLPAGRAAWSGLRHGLRLAQPEVVHTHGLRADGIGRITARFQAIPAILSTIHDSPDMYSLALGRARGAAALGLQLATLPLAHRLVMVSHLTGQAYRALPLVGRLARHSLTIHNGVRDCYLPVDTSPEQNTLTVGSLARLTPRKGIHGLIEAAARLRPSRPHLRYRVAGAGEMADALAAQIAAAGLTDIFQLVGPQADVPAFLAGLDLFVLPSLDECLPLAVLEAMSAGKAIIATDVGGVSEAIQPGVNGRLIPPRDVGALSAALGELADDAPLRRQFGAAARHDFLTRFTLDAMVDTYAQLYTDLLRQSATNRRVRLEVN